MKIYSNVQFIVLMEISLIKENFRINKKFVDAFFFLYYNMGKKFGGEIQIMETSALKEMIKEYYNELQKLFANANEDLSNVDLQAIEEQARGLANASKIVSDIIYEV